MNCEVHAVVNGEVDFVVNGRGEFGGEFGSGF